MNGAQKKYTKKSKPSQISQFMIFIEYLEKIFSWENGLSQDEFAEGIEKYANAVGGQQVDLESVSKELGDNATARVEAVQLWMNKFFPDPAMQEAVATLGSSAAGIKALEHVIEQTKGSTVSPTGVPAGQVSQADVEAKRH